MTDINTPDVTLYQTEALMSFDRNSGSEVQYLFDPTGADSESYPRAVQISTLAWLEMGRPDVVTVAVQPGDHVGHDHSERLQVGGFGRFLARAIGYVVGLIVLLGIVAAAAAGLLGLFLLLRNLLVVAGS